MHEGEDLRIRIRLEGFTHLVRVDRRAQALSTITGTPPVRLTFSSIRPPNTPLRQTITLSPGSTRLTKHISIPAEPGAETGKVSAFSVWNAMRSMDLICSIRSTNAGSRWPMVGRAMASRMRWGTSEGPGPMRMRLGGMKEAVITLFSLWKMSTKTKG